MNEAVSGLLEMLASEDPEVRREAVLRLALVLELNAMPPASRVLNRADYALSLPEHLIDTELSGEDKLEILLMLHRIFHAAPDVTEIPWAMGKSGSREAIDLLLEIIASRGDDLSEEAWFQAISAIEKYVFRRDCDLSGNLKPKLLELVDRSRPPMSERLAEVLSCLEYDLSRAGN
jgi:HEAT repeat protein